MILAESPRLYPVFTHHAKELEAAARYLVRQMVRQAGTSEPDGKFNALLDRHRQVIRTFTRMKQSRTPYVYLNLEERELVGRVNAWLRKHPENRAG